KWSRGGAHPGAVSPLLAVSDRSLTACSNGLVRSQVKRVRWGGIAPGVLIRRYGVLALTVVLFTWDHCALAVVARGDYWQGGVLASAVREMTALPWQVVLTHGHFDHCFGTSAFLPAPVWAHRDCPDFLARTAERQRREWVHHYRQRGDDAT